MNIFKRIRNLFSFGSDNVPKGVNPEHVEACRRIIKAGRCKYAGVYCEPYCIPDEHVRCANCGHAGGHNGWSCVESAQSARKWLADHGIKE